jgi:hypothetical protein
VGVRHGLRPRQPPRLIAASGLTKATGPGKHAVVKQAYVYQQAGKIFDGTLKRGETFRVERLSPSGAWAYGMAYGHVNRHAWIDASVLQAR